MTDSDVSNGYAHRQVRPPGHRASVTVERFQEDALLSVLEDATTRLEREGVDHVVMGGVAVASLARPRWTHDIDLLVRPDDAAHALQLLDDGGYETEETDPLWLFKAWRGEVPVDLIFASEGGYYLDDEILERARRVDFKGQTVRVIPPEDLLVIKVAAHKEDAPHHWFDALSLLVRSDLDAEYLLQRSRRSVSRMLSLLLYAESLDIAVPDRVVERLARERDSRMLPDPRAQHTDPTPRGADPGDGLTAGHPPDPLPRERL